MNPVGILLAAGRGRRFDPGGAANKLLQPLAGAGGDCVVAASARRLLSCLDTVVAVVAPDDGGVAVLLRALGCEVTVCPDADSGMAASLVYAIGHSLSLNLPQNAPQNRPQTRPQGWLIALGDMPFVRADTIAALRDALVAGAGIVVPVHGGRRGNPAGFGAASLPDLLALHGDQGARAIIKAGVVTEVQVDDPGIFSDIDTRSDLPKTSTLP